MQLSSAPLRAAFRIFMKTAIALQAFLLACPSAFAQSPQLPETPPGVDIVLTPGRSPQSIQRSGSAVTVISAEEIAKANPASPVDLLRSVPGLDISQAGGPGAAASVRLRGADTRHTLVLIDGIRVNDPSDVGGAFDFSNLPVGDIERIEVLRGPQSALYGSDAIGGVVHIITRRGRGKPSAFAVLEGGSYGTKSLRAGFSGGTQSVSYAFSVFGLETAGFSRFGYRIPRLTNVNPGRFENDSTRQYGANGRLSFRPIDQLEITIGGAAKSSLGQFDNSFAPVADTPDKGRNTTFTGYISATLDTFEGRLKHDVKLYSHRTSRSYTCIVQNLGCFVADGADIYSSDASRNAFRGGRTGAEYQATARLGSVGTLIAGASLQRETYRETQRGIGQIVDILFTPVAVTPRTVKAGRNSNAVFALYQLPVGEQLNLSFGARSDGTSDFGRFNTWRATAAYRIPELGTKFRASIGTGAKAPSLYQQFSVYGPLASGAPALRAEKSTGIDAGIDQDFFGGRARLSVTGFANRLNNLIDFDGSRGVLNPVFLFPVGQYVNIARAEIVGVEIEGRATLWEGYLSARLAYTNQQAKDRLTNLPLLRRPRDVVKAGLIVTPFQGLTIEPMLTYVGVRVDPVFIGNTAGRKQLGAYAKLDIRADYKINENFTVFARGENLTNARYQDVFNFGTPGRSIFAGLKATW